MREGGAATPRWFSWLALSYAVAFGVLFMHLKHAPRLRTLIPFAEDPYDAIGSFAAISAVLLGLLAVVRIHWSGFREEPRHFLLRTCCAVFCAALLTAMADIVAMLRHVSAWHGHPGETELLGWLACMVLSAMGGIFRLCREAHWTCGLQAGVRWRAAFLCAGFVLVLWLYPDDPQRGLAAALAAIGVGILALYVPLAALLVALMPDPPAAPVDGGGSRPYVRWSLAAVTGLGVGVAAFMGELAGDLTGLPSGHLIVVAATFVSAGAAGLLAAYAFLGRPLGLSRR